jgi:hypothetical protein
VKAPPTVRDFGGRVTANDLRFVLGEIDTTFMGGTHVRADLFERRDGQWSWSARVTSPEEIGAGMAPRVSETGPHLVASETIGTTDALAWIRSKWGPTP